MPNSNNPFDSLDKTFNTKEVTKKLEKNLKELKDKENLPDVAMSDDDKAKLRVKQRDQDYEYARSILKQAEQYNAEAIEGILHIARNSDQPRAYEVAITAIKNLQDNAKDMIAVQEAQKRIENEDSKGKPIQTQNNLFVGSTKDLLKAIKKEQEPIDITPNDTD